MARLDCKEASINDQRSTGSKVMANGNYVVHIRRNFAAVGDVLE